MTYSRSTKIGSKGFTLVEIIVTIVVAGILGVIFMQLMGTALNSSWNSVEIVRDESNGEGIMEQIIADFVREMNSDPTNALNTLVINNSSPSKLYGENVTMAYILFDGAGNEVTSASSNTLKVTIQAPGFTSPAITGRYALTIILANSRATNDPIIFY